MSGSFICASCELRLLRRYISLRDFSVPPRASFVTFGKGHRATRRKNSQDDTKKFEISREKSIQRNSAVQNAHEQERKHWSLEEDFLQRLFRNHRAHGPYSSNRVITGFDHRQLSDPILNTLGTQDANVSLYETQNLAKSDQRFKRGTLIHLSSVENDLTGDNTSSNAEEIKEKMSLDKLDVIQSQLKELQAQIKRLQPFARRLETQSQQSKTKHSPESLLTRAYSGIKPSSWPSPQDTRSEQVTLKSSSPILPSGKSSGLQQPVITKYITAEEKSLMRKFVNHEKAGGSPEMVGLGERKTLPKESSRTSGPITLKSQPGIKTSSFEGICDQHPVKDHSVLQKPCQTIKEPMSTDMKIRISSHNEISPSMNWQSKIKKFEKFKHAVTDLDQNWPALWSLALDYWGDSNDKSLNLSQPGRFLPPKGHELRDSMQREICQTLASFLQRMAEAWINGHHQNVPRPSHTARDLVAMRMIRPAHLIAVTWIMISQATEKVRNERAENSKQSTAHLVDEICEFWELNKKFYSSNHLEDRDTWETLWQREEWISGSKSSRTKDFYKRIVQCFPQARFPWVWSNLAALAPTTFVVLNETITRDVECSTDRNKEFLAFLGRLLLGSNIVNGALPEWLHKVLKNRLSRNSQEFILKRLEEATGIAKKVNAEIDPESVMSSKRSMMLAGDERTPHGEWLIKRLARALEDHNIKFAENLWVEAQVSFGFNRIDGDFKKMPTNVFNHFLLTFFGLGRPNQAIEIWNQMAKHGVAITLATWDAMIRGSTMAKYPEGINNIWRRMTEAGVRPDSQIWRTRIYGLVTTGHWKSAIDAFEEMSHAWMNQVRTSHPNNTNLDWASLGDADEAPKPDTRTLNSLINGLARRRKADDVSRMLSWAKTLGIKLNVFSFNPLFAMAGKTGDIALMNNLLQKMQDLGLEPDVATFTTILDSVYRSETSDSQADTTAVIFKEMERIGIEPNSWTFAALIKSLLISNNNLLGAIEILKYMDMNEIQISPQIYTSFADYYFGQPQPDLAAVEKLWQRAEKDPYAHLEGFFYDRMIEGYSRAAEVGKATTLLMHAAKRGLSPSWVAMTELLRAHARNNDRSRMEELVANVRLDESMRDSILPRFGRKQFWALVRSLGLPDVFEPEYYDENERLAHQPTNAILAAS